MFNRYKFLFLFSFLSFFLCFNWACKKKEAEVLPEPIVSPLFLTENKVDSLLSKTNYFQVAINPTIKLIFSNKIDRATVANSIYLNENGVTPISINIGYSQADSIVIITPQLPLKYLTRYTLKINNTLASIQKGLLNNNVSIGYLTKIDSTDKFLLITDNALLDKVQQQTFKYFWDFGHPVSGMARERNTSGDLVTSGGTGFGVMAIVTAASRGFITRADAAARVLKISNFLLTNCTKYHGAFAHWINGVSGATIPFSANDNGGDLVETSLLLQGLITARQYFSTADATETDLRNKINTIYNGVEWNWYRQNNQNVLYWHWSTDKGWIINQQISGWNEALIVYALAASAPTVANRIPPIVYTNGWARNGALVNNNSYFGLQLPLGPALGGPLFLSQYSFVGINPNGLVDTYADYKKQVTNHTKINYEYCKANPRGWNGYSSLCWGLTASDVPNGYNANEPNNDIGVISPTAAISAIPFTPTESMNALRFFYYKLGDKLWGQYGFYDAFKLNDPWVANSYLAINQGPMIIMIENYRTGLLWNLFTTAPEIKSGLLSLGFTAPYL
jgi:hypothetical protein